MILFVFSLQMSHIEQRQQAHGCDGQERPLVGVNNPINSGAGKRTEVYCFLASTCFLRMSGSWATLVASYHRALAKGDEAIHSPRSCQSKGSCKLLAPLKRVSVILSSRSMSREKGITRATERKKEVGSGVSGGTAEGCVGLHKHL